MQNKIARVFPRRTKASPNDELAFFDVPGLFPPLVNAVNISVTFTWDIPRAEWLAKQWKHVARVELGGPAFGKPSGDFVAGKYLKYGYTITSRGCPNKCWFCKVWRREPRLIELPIQEGWNVLDDNLLACSENHIKAVFEMLKRQPEKPQFTGGLEAKILKDWHVDLILSVKPKRIFLAYDTPDDYEPLVVAAKKIFDSGALSKASNNVRAYVLMGWKEDTIEKALKRLQQVLSIGVYPMPMVLRDDETGNRDPKWIKFAWPWSRPACIKKLKESIGM